MGRDTDNYYIDKDAYAYKLYKENKYCSKSRALVCKDKKLLLIKINYPSGDYHYLFPGGGVEMDETPKMAAIREAYEEYGAKVRVIKYLGRQYYKFHIDYHGESFDSKRIDHYYICEYIDEDKKAVFGIQGEFDRDDREYEKVALDVDTIKTIPYKKLNDIDKKNYDKLIQYMESL